MLLIDEASAGQAVALPVGQAAELRLAENPTTGFRWRLDTDGAPVCRVSADRFEPAGAPAPQRAGQGGTHVWRIEGVRAGTCEIALRYIRPWEAGAAPARTFTVRLSVA